MATATIPSSRTVALPHARAALGLGALVLFSLLLRTRAIDAGYWIDEGLSVGIASHDLGEIPGLLREDGAPPLYYLLLHGWMQAFGTSEAATHGLSLLLALMLIPTAWWAGRALFGTRAGWLAAALAAVHPFLTYYAQETRMYTLVALLSLVVCTTFALGVVHGRRRALPLLALSLAALALTHHWGLFLGAGIAAAMLVHGGPRRRDGALALAGAAVLYLPWLPSLVVQVRETGAPWSSTPGVGDLLHSAVSVTGGGAAVALLAGLALRDRRGAGGPRPAEAAMATAAVVALALAFLSSQLEPAWATRYLTVLVGPVLLLAAALLARAGTVGLAALGALAVLWSLTLPTDRVAGKSNVATLAVQADLVVVAHPESTPTVAHYLGDRARYADLLGPVADPRAFDWRDAMARLQRADPRATAAPLVASLQPGQRLALLLPITTTGRWNTPWTALVKRRAQAWAALLAADPRLVRRPAASPGDRGLRVVLYERRSG